MKKTNIIVSIVVALVCIVAGFIIFRPNPHPFNAYYQEIISCNEYKNESQYLDIKITKVTENKVDLVIDNASEVLYDLTLLIVPEEFDLNKSYPSVGLLEEKEFVLCPTTSSLSGDDRIYKDGIAVTLNYSTDSFIIYLDFKLENNNEVKEIIKVNV